MQELFTIRELAEMLKISTSSIYRYVESGKIEFVKVGSNIRFKPEHISTFLSQNESKKEQSKIYSLSLADLQEIDNLF